jgi:hypothetical protein
MTAVDLLAPPVDAIDACGIPAAWAFLLIGLLSYSERPAAIEAWKREHGAPEPLPDDSMIARYLPHSRPMGGREYARWQGNNWVSPVRSRSWGEE